MTVSQLAGYCLNQTTAITAVVSTRINSGSRPINSVVPAINYFVLNSSRSWGMEYATISFNCRATTAETALRLAREVENLFHGTSSTGTYGVMNNFEISRASLVRSHGLKAEPADEMYNAPVDILFVYPSSSVS